jgi:Leucine-rich repeat (LRR) protein
MKEMILKWKTIFPIQEYEIKHSMTDKMLGNMIINYSHNITKLAIPYNRPLLTMDGYNHVALLHSNLLELVIHDCLKGGLCVISHSLVNLTSLSIYESWSVSSEDLDSLSKLTNLEIIYLEHTNFKKYDAAVVNFSTLTKITSITVRCCHDLSLSHLVANKQFLVELEIFYCHEISSEEFHCLTTLTNLTYLTIADCELGDIGLNMICSSCLFIEYLDVGTTEIQLNDPITIEGLNNIHCLIFLRSLFLSDAGDHWLAKLSHSTSLTHLDFEDSTISDAGLSHLSSLDNLTSVTVNGKDRPIKRLKSESKRKFCYVKKS